MWALIDGLIFMCYGLVAMVKGLASLICSLFRGRR